MHKTVSVKLNPRSNEDICEFAGTIVDPADISFGDGMVSIDGVLTVPYSGPLALPSDVVSASISNDGGRFHLNMVVPSRVRPLPEAGRSVGIDLGVYYLAVTSDGLKVRPHEDIVRLDKLIRKQQDHRDSKTTDSTRYRELSRQIARNQRRLLDIQTDQANKLAKELVENYDMIAVEEINANGVKIQHHPDYKLAAERANWPLLIDVLQLRAFETGREVIMVPPWWTSQMCGRCGWYAPKPLNNRTHYCCKCQFKEERDTNAAMAIRQRGIDILNGSRRTDWHPIGHDRYVPDQD